MTRSGLGYLGCVRVDSRGIVTLGSIKLECHDCSAAIWVAPTGVAMLASKGLEPVCLPCVAVRMASDPEPEIMGMTPEQAEEARATLREWGRDR